MQMTSPAVARPLFNFRETCHGFQNPQVWAKFGFFWNTGISEFSMSFPPRRAEKDQPDVRG
jgi:hypothetical protein